MSAELSIDPPVMLAAGDALERVRNQTRDAAGSDLRLHQVPSAAADLGRAMEEVRAAWGRFSAVHAALLDDLVADTRLPAHQAMAADAFQGL